MFGQAPYIINTMLTYNIKKIGMAATLSYNLQGSKLVIITDPTKPDIYELPRHLIDFKISQKISRHFSASIKVMDILNSATVRAYKDVVNKKYLNNIWNDVTNKNKDENNIIYSKFRYGTNYVFSVAYKF